MRTWDRQYAIALIEQACSEYSTTDLAGRGAQLALMVCRDRDCGRTFRGLDALKDHAEAVHTFSDTERLVSEAVRERYGRRGDYRAEPPIPSIYCWVNDIATDWVVFTVEGGGSGQINETLYKASYTIDENNTVTLGDPTEVVRRTVYEPVTA